MHGGPGLGSYVGYVGPWLSIVCSATRGEGGDVWNSGGGKGGEDWRSGSGGPASCRRAPSRSWATGDGQQSAGGDIRQPPASQAATGPPGEAGPLAAASRVPSFRCLTSQQFCKSWKSRSMSTVCSLLSKGQCVRDIQWPYFWCVDTYFCHPRSNVCGISMQEHNYSNDINVIW